MSLKVLIIDDDEAVRFFHRIIVTQSGLCDEPLCFVNGEQALNYLDTNFIANDNYLLLLDINMPVMNGWDVLDILKTKSYTSQVNVVMVTSSVDKSDHEKAKQYYPGVIDFIEKPISGEDYSRVMKFFSVLRVF